MGNIIILSLIVAVISYLLGSINASIIISKVMGKNDIREQGSGNAGATNMLRTYGKKAGIYTLIFDVLKGAIAVVLANVLIGIWKNYFDLGEYTNLIDNIKYLAALFVVLGHTYPIFFGFKGGKGIATSAAVILMVDYIIGIPVIMVAVAIMAITKYVSLGSICAGLLFVAATIIKEIIVYNTKGSFNAISIVFSIFIGAFVVYKHKDNIVRLKNGTESKLGSKKK